jgi:homoserine kinase type II
VRPLSAAERALLPALLRAGALRFWVSRLWDFHLPREASLLKPHDPTHFERVLRQRVTRPLLAADLLAAPAPAPAHAE